MTYTAYGLNLSSTFPLPELPIARSKTVALHVTRDSRVVPDRGWTWFQARPKRTSGSWVAIASRRGDYRLLFDGGAEFFFRPGRRSIAVRAGRSPSLSRSRHRLIDQVVPLAMSYFGRIVLHASAVITREGAVAFVGPAGAGKSTLAAGFARAGAAVLSDDALALESDESRWLAVPAYPGVRLRSGRGRTKRRLTAAHGVAFASAPLPLLRVYVLKESARKSDPVRISRLSPRDSIMALVEYAFVLDTESRDRMAAHFARVSSAAAALDICELVYPRKMSALRVVRQAVLAHASLGSA